MAPRAPASGRTRRARPAPSARLNPRASPSFRQRLVVGGVADTDQRRFAGLGKARKRFDNRHLLADLLLADLDVLLSQPTSAAKYVALVGIGKRIKARHCLTKVFSNLDQVFLSLLKAFVEQAANLTDVARLLRKAILLPNQGNGAGD